MKLTRKLIPAFAMLLLSAVLLSTASFAWFTSNANVAATGVTVQATTSTNLLISKTSDSAGFEVAVGLADSGTMKPVSTNAKVTGGEALTAEDVFADSKFFSLSETATGINYTSGALSTTETVLQAATKGTDFKAYDLWVKLEGDADAAYDLLFLQSLTVTPAVPTVNVSKSLRVAIVGQNGSTYYSYLFAPLGGSYIEGKSVASLNEGKPVLADQAISTEVIGDKEVAFGSMEAGTVVSFKVFVWYEGNDVNCTSTNATSSENLAISFNFEVANND